MPLTDTLDNLFAAAWDKENVVFDIPPGTYPVSGILGPAGPHQLKRGWKIAGAGIDRTVIKLDAVQEIALAGGKKTGFNIALTTWFTDVDNVEICDLTIDLNYEELSQRTKIKDLGLCAILLNGKNCKVRNVKVINASGRRLLDSGQYQENFIVVLGGIAKPSTGQLIEDCEISSVAGGYNSAIALQSADSGPVSGIVRGCRIVMNGGGTEFGLNVCNAHDCLFENNRVEFASRCFGNDSCDNSRLTLRNNVFVASAVGAFIGSSRQCLFENNQIYLNHESAVGIAIYQQVPGMCRDWTIRGNTVQWFDKPGKSASGLIAGWGGKQSAEGLIIENNRFVPGLNYSIDRSACLLIENNRDMGGKMVF